MVKTEQKYMFKHLLILNNRRKIRQLYFIKFGFQTHTKLIFFNLWIQNCQRNKTLKNDFQVKLIIRRIFVQKHLWYKCYLLKGSNISNERKISPVLPIVSPTLITFRAMITDITRMNHMVCFNVIKEMRFLAHNATIKTDPKAGCNILFHLRFRLLQHLCVYVTR